jgi:hypothetical protein
VERAGVRADQRDAVILQFSGASLDGARDARAEFVERLATTRRIRLGRARGPGIEVRIRGDDLLPREPFPSTEAHLAPVGVDSQADLPRTQDDPRGLRCTDEVARDGEVDSLIAQQRTEGRRLRTALIVQRNIRVSLKPPVRVPLRPPVTNDD